jgi:hypothetical protein
MPTPDEQRTAEQQRRRDELIALLLAPASISDGDVDAARAMWAQHSQPAYRGLLDGSDRYTFNPQTQLYARASTGRTIPADELKRVSVAFAMGVARDVLEPDAAKVAQGGIDVEKWAQQTGQDVKDLALTVAALAAGGFDKLSGPTIDRIIGQRDKPPGLKFTLDRLANFAGDIEEKQPRAASEGAIITRAGAYGRSQNSMFEDVRRDSHKSVRDGQGRLQYLYERNLLGPAETHCQNGKFSTGCIECEAAGWVPIGSLPLPGLRTCQGSCLCSMDYSLIGPAADTN